MSIRICVLIAVFGLAGTTLSAEQSVVVPVEPVIHPPEQQSTPLRARMPRSPIGSASSTRCASTRRLGGVESRKAAAASVRRRVRRGPSEIWALAGAHHNAWRHTDVRFYSPLALSRLDAGVEWTRWLHPPRFRADRRSLWSVRYLAGADSDGEIYHQPRGRVSIEHRRVALDAEVSAVISPVYHSLTFHLGVRVGG